MIELELDAGTVGNTVFGFSPLAELAASVCRLGRPVEGSVHAPWISAVRPRLGDGTLDLLLALMGGDARWVPDFLFPAVTGRHTLDDQLDAVAALDDRQLAHDLTEPWPDENWPTLVRDLLGEGADAGRVLAAALHHYWSEAIDPYWPRIRTALEDDVSYRASRLPVDGLFAVLQDLDVAIGISGQTLTIEHPGPDHHHQDASFVLVPSVFAYPSCIITHTVPGTFQIAYGARGAARVWEDVRRSPSARDHASLEALLGANRALILRSLAAPTSTTQLAGDLAQSPSVVSRHLRVLHASGLAVRRRSGRVVLYERSPLATSLVEANEG